MNFDRVDEAISKTPAPATPRVVHDVPGLRAIVAEWRQRGDIIALVPTMGALHAGHISLVEEAKKYARRIVMSIFVNPAQFAPHEDFTAYPRTPQADVDKFMSAGGDLVFAPHMEEMYRQGFAASVSIGGPALAGLEDRFRPTHFAGVALVVAKLFNQVAPDVAIFGEKDFQQLKVISRMAADLDFATRIVGAPIIREGDGLALSSRNIYLSADERLKAPALHKALCQCAEDLKGGRPLPTAIEAACNTIRAAGFVIDYLEARDCETLAPIETIDVDRIRLLVAAKLGRTRLIDNIAVEGN
jgi:pantoate--beta-alanine ligase